MANPIRMCKARDHPSDEEHKYCHYCGYGYNPDLGECEILFAHTPVNVPCIDCVKPFYKKGLKRNALVLYYWIKTGFMTLIEIICVVILMIICVPLLIKERCTRKH